MSETESGLEVSVVDTTRAVDPAAWNAVVDRSTCGSVFHRYEWLEAIETGLGHAPKHFVVTKDGNYVGVYPNFVVPIQKTPFRRLSSSYPGFGGPAFTTAVEESLSLLVDAVPDRCTGKTVVHQVRALDTKYLRYNNYLQSEGYEPYRRECRFVLDLTAGYDAILNGMSRSRRRGIERGRDDEYEIVEEELTTETL